MWTSSSMLTTSHGAGTHSIEGKKWQEKAGHFAGDFRKHLALMVPKWDSYRTVHFRNWHQNFFRAARGRLAGRSIEHSKRYWLRFGSRAGCQNFRAFFRATLKTSRRFSIEICYVERGQCCPPIYLTSAKQHAKKKRILVLNWNCECCTPLHRAYARDNHHLTWRPHPTPAPPDYVQPYADTSWVAVEVQGCHEMMIKNPTLRHLL